MGNTPSSHDETLNYKQNTTFHQKGYLNDKDIETNSVSESLVSELIDHFTIISDSSDNTEYLTDTYLSRFEILDCHKSNEPDVYPEDLYDERVLDQFIIARVKQPFPTYEYDLESITQKGSYFKIDKSGSVVENYSELWLNRGLIIVIFKYNTEWLTFIHSETIKTLKSWDVLDIQSGKYDMLVHKNYEEYVETIFDIKRIKEIFNNKNYLKYGNCLKDLPIELQNLLSNTSKTVTVNKIIPEGSYMIHHDHDIKVFVDLKLSKNNKINDIYGYIATIKII